MLTTCKAVLLTVNSSIDRLKLLYIHKIVTWYVQMNNSRIIRLNTLFEKMVAEVADGPECSELKNLYNEYIDDGREECSSHSSTKNDVTICSVTH